MRRTTFLAAGIRALALPGATACRGTSPAKSGAEAPLPAVKIMVGGIDKVIYLPAKLTEQAGVQAENSLIAGDVQGVVGFYDHAIDLQTKGKCVESVVQFADVPGEVEVVATGKADQIKSPADFKGR